MILGLFGSPDSDNCSERPCDRPPVWGIFTPYHHIRLSKPASIIHISITCAASTPYTPIAAHHPAADTNHFAPVMFSPILSPYRLPKPIFVLVCLLLILGLLFLSFASHDESRGYMIDIFKKAGANVGVSASRLSGNAEEDAMR